MANCQSVADGFALAVAGLRFGNTVFTADFTCPRIPAKLSKFSNSVPVGSGTLTLGRIAVLMISRELIGLLDAVSIQQATPTH